MERPIRATRKPHPITRQGHTLMSFDPTSLSNFLLILTAWGGAFIAALWLSLVIWTYRDIRIRARDPLARIVSMVCMPVDRITGLPFFAMWRMSGRLSASPLPIL